MMKTLNRTGSNTAWLRLLAMSLALALLAAACGGGDDEGDDDEGVDTEETADAADGDAATESSDPSEGDTESDSDGDAVLAEPDEPASGSDAATTLRAGMIGDEASLNPYTYITGFPGWNLLMMQYDSLMQIDGDGIPQPWLAETVDVSDDGLTYSLTLAEGVTFNDGETLDASDVAFTVDYFLNNSQSRFSRALAGVTGAEATGDLTVDITLEAANPSFPLSTLSDVPIIPEHVWSEVTDPENHQFDSVTNVGSGPYVLTDYAPDQSYTMEANPDYFRGAPAVDELVLVQFADDTGAQAAIRSGEVDVIFDGVSPEQVPLLDAQDPIDIVQGPEFSTDLLYYDASKAPFDDVAVRQAMSLAMDRQDIVDTVFLGAATPGSAGWIHPDQVSFNPDVETTTDVEQANGLLEDAGYTDSDGDGIREADGEPMSYELITPSDNTLRLRTAELVSEMLAEIGIGAEVTSVESTTWEEAVWPGFDIANGRNYDLAMWGWSAPIQADASRVASLVHSDPSIGALNLTAFSNPEMDEVAQALTVEGDPDTRLELIGELQTLFAEQLPFVTLLYRDGAYAYNSEVYGEWEFIAGQGIVSKLSLLPAEARP
ncbi:ABC transporter substrate-binding protein [Euzebya tangerina]|uniref:ABC transporter substrate-binding protein n=1 Tax=Euzebya tangerina TaxID=591198 RepID=UPI000E31064D|nr:ABC transporter substrate-binding protein [Euzebya tangerina]